MNAYDYLDNFTPEDISDFKEISRLKGIESDNAYMIPGLEAIEKYIRAEGDSWFNYLPGTDLIDCLRNIFNCNIDCFAKAGDTLENMSYGTDINRNYTRDIPQFYRVINRIKAKKPSAFLFSGGGNDIAGDEFISYLNHKLSNPGNAFRSAYAQSVINDVFKGCFEYIISEVSKVSPATKIISHGYGHTLPTGIGVGLLGYNFAGPWLRPALVKKAILDPNEQNAIVGSIIDMYNDMLAGLAKKHKNFIYVDLRPILDPNSDWVNELHLKNSAYERAAEEIYKFI
jgi:hypothetical protein